MEDGKTNTLSVHFISWSKCGKIQADVWFDLSKSFPWGLGTNQKIHSWIEHFLTIREVFFVHFSEMFSRHCNWESSTRYSCALTHSNSTMLWQQLRSFRLLMLAYMGSFKNYVDPIWPNLDLLPSQVDWTVYMTCHVTGWQTSRGHKRWIFVDMFWLNFRGHILGEFSWPFFQK